MSSDQKDSEISRLKAEVKALSVENKLLRKVISNLEEENNTFRTTNRKLAWRVESYQQKLEYLQESANLQTNSQQTN